MNLIIFNPYFLLILLIIFSIGVVVYVKCCYLKKQKPDFDEESNISKPSCLKENNNYGETKAEQHANEFDTSKSGSDSSITITNEVNGSLKNIDSTLLDFDLKNNNLKSSGRLENKSDKFTNDIQAERHSLKLSSKTEISNNISNNKSNVANDYKTSILSHLKFKSKILHKDDKHDSESPTHSSKSDNNENLEIGNKRNSPKSEISSKSNNSINSSKQLDPAFNNKNQASSIKTEEAKLDDSNNLPTSSRVEPNRFIKSRSIQRIIDNLKSKHFTYNLITSKLDVEKKIDILSWIKNDKKPTQLNEDLTTEKIDADIKYKNAYDSSEDKTKSDLINKESELKESQPALPDQKIINISKQPSNQEINKVKDASISNIPIIRVPFWMIGDETASDNPILDRSNIISGSPFKEDAPINKTEANLKSKDTNTKEEKPVLPDLGPNRNKTKSDHELASNVPKHSPKIDNEANQNLTKLDRSILISSSSINDEDNFHQKTVSNEYKYEIPTSSWPDLDPNKSSEKINAAIGSHIETLPSKTENLLNYSKIFSSSVIKDKTVSSLKPTSTPNSPGSNRNQKIEFSSPKLFSKLENFSPKISSANRKREFQIDIIDLNDWNDNKSYFYHYTSLNNARLILEDRTLIAFLPKIQHFGKGIYFTVLKPSSSEEQLIKNNYIYFTKTYLSNIQCAFAFRKNDLLLTKITDRFNRDIWKYGNDIDLNRINFKIVIRKPHFRNQLNLN
jgi:cbb3-type cytochrome oxidase subunit 3